MDDKTKSNTSSRSPGDVEGQPVAKKSRLVGISKHKHGKAGVNYFIHLIVTEQIRRTQTGYF